MRRLGVLAAFLVLATPAAAATRTLDGQGNNLRHPSWGAAGTIYPRIAAPAYADGIGAMAAGPAARYVSNRIFNDVGQNLFSENDVTQWGWAWAQFVDHDIGFADERPGEDAPIGFAAADPLERFTDDLGSIGFSRTPTAPGTGVTTPRQQLNTVSSYIDASNVYGTTRGRATWLRDGARLLLTRDGYLPRTSAKPAAPPMDLFGALAGTPDRAMVAGDARANENVALTAVQTLMAREHNRIVGLLPRALSDETRFQIARRVVNAEEQYVTYGQFLRAFGVKLAPYRGYRPLVDAAVTNEFATVGYRGHSMVHGNFDFSAPAGRWSAAQLAAFRSSGVFVDVARGRYLLDVPLDLTFGNPDLLHAIGVGPVLQGLGNEREYRNDEQVDDELRSVLFQVPKVVGAACGDPHFVNAQCFTGIEDLAAIDLERARDHGIPLYNELRRAYGLAPQATFQAITGEREAALPAEADWIDDPASLAFVSLRSRDGTEIAPGTEQALEDAVSGVRKTALAARLQAVYGDVGKLDAYVGMVSEPHVRGTEFGPLQLAAWKRQFTALRDGDRFFYANDPELARIERAYGIDYRTTLAQLIRRNTGVAVQADVFKLVR
jgi:hypothetical protein